MTYPTHKDSTDLIERCGGTTSNAKAGAGWTRMFIMDSEGCSIGRLSFDGPELRAVKSYKKEHHREICETDKIFINLERSIKAGKPDILFEDTFAYIWEAAEAFVAKDLAEKQAWRDANPSTKMVKDKHGKLKVKHRKKLHPRNPRSRFLILAADYTSAEEA